MKKLEELTPAEIVKELDKYIIGQDNAKKSVAIALRNRVRRNRLSDEIRDEVAPKNIIMIGPTGVGKTEIARRISKLSGAPFIKVEATKFTEVGYVGRDVESMVRDLMRSAIAMVKNEMKENIAEEAEKATEEALLDLLLPSKKPHNPVLNESGETVIVPQDHSTVNPSTREKLRKMLHDGHMDDKMVEVKVSKANSPQIEIFQGSNMEEIGMNLGGAFGGLMGGGGQKKLKKMSVKRAKEHLYNEQVDRMIDQDAVVEMARDRVMNMGIIFIDEIDKIANRSGSSSSQDVSREGVQRDILPIVEGSNVNTRYGMIDTSHILFIAAGAFNLSKPSDLIPELQGRFPIRVELEALDKAVFQQILTTPQNSLVRQYTELMATEDVHLVFTNEGIDRIASIAEEVNSRTENIGARRLHTIMERLLEEVSFYAPDLVGQTIQITAEYVDQRLGDVVEDRDLSRYIL